MVKVMQAEKQFSRPDKIFACKVFNRQERKIRLSKSVFNKLEQTIANKQSLAPEIADDVAKAMKEWALDHGATHYTHWFQPFTESAAEKHDSFIDLSSDGELRMEFSGKMLIQGEPDASSLPSGGIRSTFEARGYTVWDPISPVFIKDADFGATLCIPSVFFSYTGEALDLKTPLLRSCIALTTSTKKLLTVLGQNCQNVAINIGVEQEYFLIDRNTYFERPDLVACGRTLIGNSPYKGQELNDHYFGSIKPRILRFMQDVENEAYRLGIPITTRHNEVAPSQFEIAPIFQDSILSSDQNLLIMQILDEVAEKYDLKALLHEKPFEGINGSGKHCNWSITADGKNLLEPCKQSKENCIFLLIIAIIIRAVDKHAEMLKISVSSARNDHRMGANEAPPAIISIFLGQALKSILDRFTAGKDFNSDKQSNIDLFVDTLPPIPKQDSDRNRTSPFAFTGNKFEFRALGSSQNIAVPNFTLNTIVADSMDYVTEQLTKKLAKKTEKNLAICHIIKEIWDEHSRIVFNGDNYSAQWTKEAKKRNLPNFTNSVDAFAVYSKKEIVDLFEKYRVLSKAEIISRQSVRLTKYAIIIGIEAKTLWNLIDSMVLPSSYQQQEQLANSIIASQQAGIPSVSLSNQKEQLSKLTVTINSLIDKNNSLKELLANAKNVKEELKAAKYSQSKILPCMGEVRSLSDTIEAMVDDSLWQLPKYQEILFQ